VISDPGKRSSFEDEVLSRRLDLNIEGVLRKDKAPVFFAKNAKEVRYTEIFLPGNGAYEG